MKFVDRATLHAVGGNGGNGCMSFRREKYVEMGGPDGGTGGKGGDVWLLADPQKSTLYDFTFRPKFDGEEGGNGLGKNQTGRGGEDLIVRVPLGTVVFKDGRVAADLKTPGERYRAARGGRGGRGNASFKTSVNTAPRISEKGEPGEDVRLDLELKLLADVGLLGLPNAGKSTFLSVVTQARPKIADYPFTTLIPNLGVATTKGRTFVIADIPGLIEGAHTGKGLGDDFLRHVDRTRVLIHLVDVFGFNGKTAAQGFRALNKELAAYSPRLASKPQIIVATKMDLTGADKALTALRRSLRGRKIVPMSSVIRRGVEEVLDAVLVALDTAPEPPPLHPEHVNVVIEPGFRVTTVSEKRFRVSGRDVDKLLAMTHFEQDEAVARFQKILKKMGVEEELRRLGAVAGNAVEAGEREFIFRPDEKTRR